MSLKLFDAPYKNTVIKALEVDVPDQTEDTENTMYSVVQRESGKIAKFEQVLSGSSGTFLTSLFKVTGIVLIQRIYGIVIVELGVNVTAVNIELYDGTARVDITKGSGTVCSGAKVNSLLVKDQDASVIITLKDAVAGFIHECSTNFKKVACPFHAGQKSGVETLIQSSYATTDAPTSGEIHWHAEWQAISGDGKLEAV